MSKAHKKGPLSRDGPLQPLLLSSSPPNAESLTTRWGPPQRLRRGGSGASPVPTRASAPAKPGTAYGAAKSQAMSANAARQRDKWVPLPEDEEEAQEQQQPQQQLQQPQPLLAAGEAQPEYTSLTVTPGLYGDLDGGGHVARQRGRVTVYCPAESFDRKKLDEVLRASFPASAIKSYPDAYYVEMWAATEDSPGGDCYFFDWGSVALWGLDEAAEAAVVQNLALQAATQAVTLGEMEIDQFAFCYSSLEKPHIQNDTITLHRKAARDHQVKLAISYALAQSTKLSLHERRVAEMVQQTKHLPESLARTGKVALSNHEIAQLIGRVFIQKAAVNLLSSVLDTPEFFWRAADSFQSLYERIIGYLEMESRIEVLNARFSVLQEMLDMLRDHENNAHATRLEMIVIWLIVVEVVVGLLEVAGLFGLLGSH